MAYTAKTWVDNSAPSVCAANLNDLETGVADAHTTADRAVAKGVLQAKGDLIAALSASSPTRVVAGADDTVLVADSAQTHGLKWVQIGNAQVLAAAAIAYSKLNLASSIVNADVAAGAAIAKSKLAALAISDSDVAAGAAIAYSKLALAGSIVNADIASSASISAPKIAGFPADSAKFLRGDATWAAPGGGLVVLVADTTLSVTAASIDIQNIAATYAHLQIIGHLRDSTAATVVGLYQRFNNDSGANYDYWGSLNGGASSGGSGATYIAAGGIPADSATALKFGALAFTVPEYSDTTNHKVLHGMASMFLDQAGTYRSYEVSGLWRSAVAINRYTIFADANLMATSRLTIYGLSV